MRELLILLNMLLVSKCQEDVLSMNPLLINDRAFRGAGVMARVTPTGTQYVAGIVAQAFSSHFADIRPPNVRQTRKLTQIPSVTVRNLALDTLHLDRNFVSTTTSDSNLLRITTTNITLSTSALVDGEIGGTPISDSITFRTSYLTMHTAVRITRNPNGNPALKMENCGVKTLGIKLVTKPMNPKNGKALAVNVSVSQILEKAEKLQDAIAFDANTIFFDLLCPKIEHILSTRVNQRFALLSSRISLEDSKNFDIIKIIMQAEERMKRVARQRIAARPLMIRPPVLRRDVRQHAEPDERFHVLLGSFNFSRADKLMLDYSMLSTPTLNRRGIELQTSGEVFETGHVTPFGAGPVSLPSNVSNSMLQIVVSDFVPNSLMFHGHHIRLFDTRVDWNTPQFGPVMRTTCDLSTGSIFCIGDLFPALREMLPDRRLAFIFSTLRAPAVIVQPEEKGGIHFNLIGLIRVVSDQNEPIGEMEIIINALMKMKLTSKSVKGKVTIEDIRFVSRTPQILLQEELDDAGFLSREILQRMVNDILRQGIPIPIHPLFKLVKPKLSLLNRSMLLETNFLLNEHIIAQLTSEKLVA